MELTLRFSIRILRCELLMFLVLVAWPLVSSAETSPKRISLIDSIVLVDVDEPSYVQFAARDLARYLSQLTNRTVPVSATASDAGKHMQAIAIGQRMALSVGTDPKSLLGLGSEGSLIRSLDRRGKGVVLVAGTDPHGTNLGVATLIQLIRSEADTVFLEWPLEMRAEPSVRVRGFHMNGGWQLNYPYGFRTWKEEDWKRFVDIVWAQRGNLVFMWPYVETLTIPLTPADEAYLKEFQRVTEYAQKQRGMEVWIMQSANRIAVTDCGVPDPRLRPHWIEGCQKDMNPADPEQLTRISKSFEALYRNVSNADAFCLIDSDPGGWAESPLSDQLKVFLEARKLLDRYSAKGTKTKLVDWMWIGWGRHRSVKSPDKLGTVFNFIGKFPDESDIAFMAETIRNFKNNLAEPWEVIAGMTPWVESSRREETLNKTIYLPYGVIEMEPAFPATNTGFDSLNEVLANQEKYPDLRGWMGNNELLLLQFPRSFYFLNSLWDSRYRSEKEEDALRDVARHLYPDHEQLIAESYLALRETIPAKIEAVISRLNKLAHSNGNLRTGAIGRFLFPDNRIVLKSLRMQLEIRLARQELIATLQKNVNKAESERLVESYFDKMLAWNKETGWEKTIDINIWRSPLFERGGDFNESLVRLKQIIGDGQPYTSYQQVEDFFDPIGERLLRKYAKNSVMIGCVEPFKLAVLQSQ